MRCKNLLLLIIVPVQPISAGDLFAVLQKGWYVSEPKVDDKKDKGMYQILPHIYFCELMLCCCPIEV